MQRTTAKTNRLPAREREGDRALTPPREKRPPKVVGGPRPLYAPKPSRVRPSGNR